MSFNAHNKYSLDSIALNLIFRHLKFQIHQTDSCHFKTMIHGQTQSPSILHKLNSHLVFLGILEIADSKLALES